MEFFRIAAEKLGKKFIDSIAQGDVGGIIGVLAGVAILILLIYVVAKRG